MKTNKQKKTWVSPEVKQESVDMTQSGVLPHKTAEDIVYYT